MEKLPLLYASPFPPQKSGISDYSEDLVKALSERFDVTLYVKDRSIDERFKKQYKIEYSDSNTVQWDKYPCRIYNIGNNPEFHSYIYQACISHPGLVILHDFILYYLTVGYYQERGDLYSVLYHRFGIDELIFIKEIAKTRGNRFLEYKDIASKLPLNQELLKSENLFMVHSWYSYNKVLQSGLVGEERIRKINLITPNQYEKCAYSKDILFDKHHIPQDALVIASFGYVAETKRNREICEAIRELSREESKKICYVMVGEGDYVNDQLLDEVICKTGYIDLDEFKSFIEYSDIVVNLRYPSMGETSAAILRILQKGKPCITNNGGWFSELPDDCVYKIEIEDAKNNIKKALKDLIDNEEKRDLLAVRARQYILNEYSSDKIVASISDFLAFQS